MSVLYSFVLFLNSMSCKISLLTYIVLNLCCNFLIPVPEKFLPSFHTSETEDYLGKRGGEAVERRRLFLERTHTTNPNNRFNNHRCKELEKIKKTLLQYLLNYFSL